MKNKQNENSRKNPTFNSYTQGCDSKKKFKLIFSRIPWSIVTIVDPQLLQFSNIFFTQSHTQK